MIYIKKYFCFNIKYIKYENNKHIKGTYQSSTFT